jgi:hypothetical protein
MFASLCVLSLTQLVSRTDEFPAGSSFLACHYKSSCNKHIFLLIVAFVSVG